MRAGFGPVDAARRCTRSIAIKRRRVGEWSSDSKQLTTQPGARPRSRMMLIIHQRTKWICATSISDTSVYPAKGLPGRVTTKLDSGAQKRLKRSRIEGYGPRPQARARLTRYAVVPLASA